MRFAQGAVAASGREERIRAAQPKLPASAPAQTGPIFTADYSQLDLVASPYSVADGTLNNANLMWRVEQDPQVLGYTQADRMRVIDTGIPGSTHPPRVLRVELRPFHNSDRTLTVADAAVPAELGVSTATVTGDLSGVNPGADSAFLVTAAGERVRLEGITSVSAGKYTIQIKRQRPNGTSAAILAIGSTLTLWAGDVNPAGGSEDATSRAEVNAQTSQWCKFNQWTYVGFWRYIDPSIVLPSGTEWVEWSQLSKGSVGGSPPLAFGCEDGLDRLAALGVGGPQHNLGTCTVGQWDYWQFGVLHHTDPAKGQVAAWKNGTKLGQWTQATVQVISSTPDLTYPKLGMYRQSSISRTFLVFYGPTKIGWTLADVPADTLVS